MKKLICLLLILITLSSCTTKKATSFKKDDFVGTWVCEIYNNDDEKLGEMIYEIKKENGSYHGVINKFTRDEKSGSKFDDFFYTDKELLFIRNNKVFERTEYFVNDEKLIIENKVFTKK